MTEKTKWSCTGSLLRNLAVVFAVIVCVCLAIAIVLLFTQKPVNLNPFLDHAQQDSVSNHSIRRKPTNYRPFTFEDLTSNKQHVHVYYQNQWLLDDSLVLAKEATITDPTSFLDGGALTIIPKNGTSEKVLIAESEFSGGFTSDHISFSANGGYVAMFKIVNHGFRHSSDALYQIAKLKNSKLTSFINVGPTGSGNELVAYLKWNPNPDKNDFIFVHQYNIYYQADPEKPGSAVKITDKGNQFYRFGLADWLYEEEIFSSSNAVWWSASGALIAYIRFDDQYVSRVYVPKYFSFRQYTDYSEIPYPKAGVANQPEVALYLWDKLNKKKVVISPPEEMTSRNVSNYIFSNNWINVTLNGSYEERLLTVWSDREQMNVYITLCSTDDCVLSFTQSFTMHGRSLWAEPSDFQEIYASATGFFVLLPHQYTDGNIYNHIAHIRVQDDGTGRVTTFHGGTHDVNKILGYDSKKDSLIYESSGGGVAFKRMFKVRNASTRLAQTQCMSCILPDCNSSSMSVSPQGTRAVLNCKNAFKNGRFYLMSTENPNNFQQLRGFEEAHLLFDPPSITHEKLKLKSGIVAHIGIMKPPKFDNYKTYPVLLNVYGGPNSYMNSLETPWDFLVYLCTSRQVVVIFVDARGSKNRGWEVKTPVRYNLGPPEADDQIDAVRLLMDKYSYLDQKSAAVMGWSYGGFLSTHIAVRDMGDTFKCALAVAPVADFLMYDSAYTERYLGLPTTNPAGYNMSRLTDKMQNMQHVHYLLAHGASDDNVHYQHSALLAGALQEKQISFDQLVYTNQDHSMVAVRPHLFREMTTFLDEKCYYEQFL